MLAKPEFRRHVLNTLASLQRQRFWKDVAILGGGTALAQSLNVLMAPVLTRIYKPVAFGQYALFVSFLNVATVGLSLRYELGIVAVQTERKAAELAVVACLLVIPMSALGSGILLSLIRFSILGFNELPAYSAVLTLCALLLAGIFSVLRYWFVRQEQFGRISQALVVQSGVRCLSQIVLGVVSGQLGGLLGGEILGRSAATVRMFGTAFQRIRPLMISSNALSIAEVLGENRQFPLYSFASSLVDSAAANLPLPLLVWYYGAQSGGYFSLVQRVLAVPLVLISASVADAFQARLALYMRTEPASVKSIFRKTGLGLLWVGLLPTGVLVLFGEPAFRFVFGRSWTSAGKMAAIVAPLFLAQFIISPLSRLVFVLGGQRWKMSYDVLAVSGVIGVFLFSKWQNLPLMQVIKLLSAVGTFTFIVYYIVLARIVTRFDGHFRSRTTQRAPLESRLSNQLLRR
jgi:lipopolysaccharide exporter